VGWRVEARKLVLVVDVVAMRGGCRRGDRRESYGGSEVEIMWCRRVNRVLRCSFTLPSRLV
jgi:hypothetical protein